MMILDRGLLFWATLYIKKQCVVITNKATLHYIYANIYLFILIVYKVNIA